MKALTDRNLPYTHFVGPVVVGVVGGLNLAVVLLHLATTDGCRQTIKNKAELF